MTKRTPQHSRSSRHWLRDWEGPQVSWHRLRGCNLANRLCRLRAHGCLHEQIVKERDAGSGALAWKTERNAKRFDHVEQSCDSLAAPNGLRAALEKRMMRQQ